MKGKQIKSIIKEALSSLENEKYVFRGNKMLNEQTLPVPLTGQCNPQIALTINSVEDVPGDNTGNSGPANNLIDYMASLPPNSTVRVTTDQSVTDAFYLSNVVSYAQSQYAQQETLVFAYEPQISDFSQPWNPQYYFITNGDTGYSAGHPGIFYCSYTSPQLNTLSAGAGSSIGSVTSCDQLEGISTMYAVSLANYPDVWAEGCATNNFSVFDNIIPFSYTGPIGDGFGIGYGNEGNAFELMTFYCSCPQIPDYEPEPDPVEPDPVEPDPVVPDPVVPDPSTMGGVKPGGNIPTKDPLKGPAKPPISTTATPIKGQKPPIRPGMKPRLREQIERMQKLANIKKKK